VFYPGASFSNVTQLRDVASDGNSMSTGCAVLFGGNVYGFFKFPLGGTTDFLGRFL
jgi:hypothetical protein